MSIVFFFDTKQKGNEDNGFLITDDGDHIVTDDNTDIVAD